MRSFMNTFSNWIIKLSTQLTNLTQKLFLIALQWVEKLLEINYPRIPLTAIQWVLLGYFIFAGLFVINTPPFEAGDEVEQIELIVAWEQGETIDYTDNFRALNPSLYYSITSLFTPSFEFETTDDILEANPYVITNNFSQLGNKNQFMHPIAEGELIPAVQGIYLLRVINVLLGVIIVFITYRIGLLINTQRPIIAPVGAVITAFNPMFLYIVASVNPLALEMTLISIGFYGVIHAFRYSFKPFNIAMMGICLGLATGVGIAAFGILGVTTILMLYVAQRSKNWVGFGQYLILKIIVVAIVSGTWLASNLEQFNTPFPTNTAIEQVGIATEPFTFQAFLDGFQTLRLSYWGLFGQDNIITNPMLYSFLDMITFIGLIGVAFSILQLIAIRDFSYARRELSGLIVLVIFSFVAILSYIFWAFQVRIADGIILFPFMAMFSVFIASGVVELIWWFLFLLSPPERSFVRAGEAVASPLINLTHRWLWGIMAFMVFFVPISSLPIWYQVPEARDELPSNISVPYVNYGTHELIGYNARVRRYIPGEIVPITFYWRALEVTESDLMASVALINPDGEEIGKINTYPNMGRLRTSQWEVDGIYADTYYVRLSPFIDEPIPFSVELTWWNRDEQERVQALSRTGDVISHTILDVGAVVPVFPADLIADFLPIIDADKQLANFAETFQLDAFSFDWERQEILLRWHTLTSPPTDYTAFLHIYDSDGELVAQNDVTPELPTSFWRFDERFVTSHYLTLDAPLKAGDYQIEVGWYRLNTNSEGTYSAGNRVEVHNPSVDELPVFTYMLLPFSIDEFGTLQSDKLEELQALIQPDVETAPIAPEASPEVTLEVTVEATEEVTPESEIEITPEVTSESD